MTKIDAVGFSHALDATAIAQISAGLQPVPMHAEQLASLRDRVLQIAARPAAPAGQVVKAGDGKWIALSTGVHIKALRVDAKAGTHTSLWRMDAGAVLPEHDHSAEEECLVIAGSVEWAGDRYLEGDYLVVPAEFHHTEIHSAMGATLLIRGELKACLVPVLAASLS